MGIDEVLKKEVRATVREEISIFLASQKSVKKRRYNTTEAAEYCGLALTTFRKFIPEVGGTKIGRNWSFTEMELDAFCEKHRRKTVDEIREAV